MKNIPEQAKQLWHRIKKPPYPAAFGLYFVITLFFDAVMGLSRSGGIGYLVKHLIAALIFAAILCVLESRGILRWQRKNPRGD